MTTCVPLFSNVKVVKLFGASVLIFATLLSSSQVALAQFTQQGPKLVGSGAVGNANQGRSVALSADGNTAIVGSGSGAAWAFTRSHGVWTQQGTIGQGLSVSLSADGNTAIVGSGSGAAIYTRRHGVWTQHGRELVGNDAAGNANQGFSVSLSHDGNTAIVGGPADNGGIGAAWVYTRSHGVWTQQGSKLVGTGAAGNASQGWSVALSGDGKTAIVGGPEDPIYPPVDGPRGAAWVYTRSHDVWTQQGSKLVGNSGCAFQGSSVALSADGNTAIVGGPGTECDVIGSGRAWVFTRSDRVWTQQSVLEGTGTGNEALQGASVALSADGNTAIVGGPGGIFAPPVGAAWVYTRSHDVWTQQGSKLVGTGAAGYASQGSSVALSADGNTALIGGPGDNGGMGATWVFIQPTKDDCKEGGWLNFVSPMSPFRFTNQGQCASYFAQQQIARQQ
jgi:hypothetical protein